MYLVHQTDNTKLCLDFYFTWNKYSRKKCHHVSLKPLNFCKIICNDNRSNTTLKRAQIYEPRQLLHSLL